MWWHRWKTVCFYFTLFNYIFTVGVNWEWKSSDLDLIIVCGDKTYSKYLDLNRDLGVGDLPRKVQLDRKSAVNISFTVSLIIETINPCEFQRKTPSGISWKILTTLKGDYFFASSSFVAILPKMNQSSEDFFYLTYLVRIVLGTFILPSFSCIDAFFVDIFDVHAKKLRTERSEIQQGIIQ